MWTRRIPAAGVALLLAAATVACGEDTEPRRTSATEHNAADVEFASDLLQHHAQALALVDLTRGRSLPPEVTEVAEEITLRHGPEVETLTDWLVDWDEEIPATVRDHVNAGHGGDHGDDDGDDHESADDVGTDLPGMPSSEELAALESAEGAAFAGLWLETMTEHHEGAVELAREEQAEGMHEPAIELAEQVEAAQQEEIDRMAQLLTAR